MFLQKVDKSQWHNSHYILDNKPRFYETPPGQGDQLDNSEASLLISLDSLQCSRSALILLRSSSHSRSNHSNHSSSSCSHSSSHSATAAADTPAALVSSTSSCPKPAAECLPPNHLRSRIAHPTFITTSTAQHNRPPKAPSVMTSPFLCFSNRSQLSTPLAIVDDKSSTSKQGQMSPSIDYR